MWCPQRHGFEHFDNLESSSLTIFLSDCLLQSVMYREGNLISGRLEALIQHMVPTADYYPDRAFLFAFLLTSRLFVKPHDLLGQISANCREHMKVINKVIQIFFIMYFFFY